MDRDASVRFELLTIQGRQNSDVLLRATAYSATDDGIVLVNHLHEVTRVHMHALNSQDL